MHGKQQVFITVLFVFFLMSFGLTAQDSGVDPDSNEDEITIEELYLSIPIKVQVIKSQAESSSRTHKLLAIESIREMIAAGELEVGDPEVHSILEFLAYENVMQRALVGGKRVANNYPEVRRQAVIALGELGGEDSMRTLKESVTSDPDPVVMAHAARSLGKIGMDPQGSISLRIARMLEFITQKKPDNYFANEGMVALYELSKHNDGYVHPEVFPVLVKISEGNYIREVKVNAFTLLAVLKSY